MTDILDRPDSLVAEPEARPEPPAAEEPKASKPAFLCSPMLRSALAAAVIAAGAVHLTVGPAHMGDAPILGWGFLVAGWVQIGLGMLALLRPSRAACWSILIVNAA